MNGLALARAAETLVGTPYRLGGRDQRLGLDCLGVLAAAMERIGCHIDLPKGYRLKIRHLDLWLPDPDRAGFISASAPFLPGDVVLLRTGPGQFHLAIADADRGWVHAHAGLRRIVRQAEMPSGTIAGHWRAKPLQKAEPWQP